MQPFYVKTERGRNLSIVMGAYQNIKVFMNALEKPILPSKEVLSEVKLVEEILTKTDVNNQPDKE